MKYEWRQRAWGLGERSQRGSGWSNPRELGLRSLSVSPTTPTRNLQRLEYRTTKVLSCVRTTLTGGICHFSSLFLSSELMRDPSSVEGVPFIPGDVWKSASLFVALSYSSQVHCILQNSTSAHHISQISCITFAIAAVEWVPYSPAAGRAFSSGFFLQHCVDIIQ